MIFNRKCKYRKQCESYQEDSALCDCDGGTWSYGKKANCFMDFYKESKSTGFLKRFKFKW